MTARWSRAATGSSAGRATTRRAGPTGPPSAAPVSPPELTETTIRWLFATAWLPCDTSQQVVAVPGGSTTAIDTAGNLLHIAMCNLRGRGLMEFEQVRPVEREPVRVLGGEPFSGHTPIDRDARLPGLEGALLDAARVASPGDVRAL